MISRILYDFYNTIWFLEYYMIPKIIYDIILFLGYYMIIRILYDS